MLLHTKVWSFWKHVDIKYITNQIDNRDMQIETSFSFDHERTQGALLWKGSREEYEAYTRDHPIIRLTDNPPVAPSIETLLKSTGCQILSDGSIRLASREQMNYLQERKIPFKIEEEIIVCPRY